MKTDTARIHRMALLWWVVLCAPGALSIKVQFGTSGGPIVPPPPEPPRVPPPPPYRVPAPVWEDRSADLPDPNTNWRPLFVPSARYTQVNYNPSPPVATAAPALTSAQRFVSAYLPQRPAPGAPAPAPGHYFQPAAKPQDNQQGQQLSSQSVPGIGIRYFVPAAPAQEDEPRANRIDGDEPDAAPAAGVHDAQLSYEKESRRRTRASQEGTQNVVYYQWPVYIAYRHH